MRDRYTKGIQSLAIRGLLLLAVCLVVPHPLAFAGDWKNAIASAISEIASNVVGVEKLYVSVPQDSDTDKRYYSFVDKTVHRVLENSVQHEGIAIVGSPLDASHYLETEFDVSKNGLSLFFVLKASGSTEVSASKILDVENSLLPEDWNERTLRDIAHELVSKLESALLVSSIA